MADTPLVSVMLPCRGRYEGTRQSLASLALATDPSQLEVLVRADDDDPETVKVCQEAYPFPVHIMVGPRGGGYADLHHMYNQCAAAAKGRFLLLWNNDAIMQTPGWDDKLRPFDDGKLRYFHVKVTPDDQILSFPILHRSWYDCLGHYSTWAHNDSYVYRVLEPLFPAHPGLYQEVDIHVHHLINDYLEAGDVPSVEGRAKWGVTRPVRRTPEYQVQVRRDREKLLRWLAEKK